MAPGSPPSWLDRAVATITTAAAVILVVAVSIVLAVPLRAERPIGSAVAPVAAVAPPVRILIPALGVDAAVVPLALDDRGALEVPQDADLVGWYRLSPRPGEVGPAVLAGHLDWRGEPGVFRRLDELLLGDLVKVVGADGEEVSFTVTAVEQHPKRAFPTVRVYGDTAAPELRLITCGGAFDQRSQHYRDNVIAFASSAGGSDSSSRRR